VLNSLKQLKQRQGFMRYFTNTSWLLGERILRMGVGLFVGIWIARYLGPEQFGLLSYAQSIVFLFTAIATLGLDGIVVRELVKDESKRDILLGTAFGLKLIGAIIILPVLFLAVQFTNSDDYTNLLVFIIASATMFQSFNVIDFYYQSKVLSKYVALANAVVLALSSTIKIVLLLNEAPLLAFAAMTVFDGLVLALGLVYFYIKTSGFKLLGWVFSGAMAKRLLNDSWPLILSGLVISVYMKIDQVMIKEMLNAEAVGQYAAAVKLSEAWYFIPGVISASLFPAMVNAKNLSQEIYYARLQKLYDLMVWLAIAIALPVTFLGGAFIKLLYGEAYGMADTVLVIHVWSGVFVSLGLVFGKYLTNEGLTKVSFYRSLSGAIVNIVLNYLLIPYYGIEGAAMATLFGQLVANYGYDFFDKRLHSQLKMKTRSFMPIHYMHNKRGNIK